MKKLSGKIEELEAVEYQYDDLESGDFFLYSIDESYRLLDLKIKLDEGFLELFFTQHELNPLNSRVFNLGKLKSIPERFNIKLKEIVKDKK